VNGVETQHRTSEARPKSDQKPNKLRNKKQGRNNLVARKISLKNNWQMDVKALVKNGCLINGD